MATGERKFKAEITVERYSVDAGNIIGKGAFGVVYIGTDDKGKEVAVKRIDGTDKHKMAKVTKDLHRLLELDHPNIVKLLDIHHLDTTMWMFMEYCPNKDLAKYFQKIKLNERQKLDLMIQIAEGIEFLHRKDIIHRDVKPGNILVSANPAVAKLTDFDLSKFLDPDESSLMTTTVGTDAFKAPEFYQRDQQRKIHYHRSVDIYALGLTYLAMVQENKNLVPQIETPGQDSELHEPIGRLIAERIKYGKEPLAIFPKSAVKDGKHIRSLIAKMTCHVPTERIAADEVLKHLKARQQYECDLVCNPTTESSCEKKVKYFYAKRNF